LRAFVAQAETTHLFFWCLHSSYGHPFGLQSLPHQESIRGNSMLQPGKKENKNKITLF